MSQRPNDPITASWHLVQRTFVAPWIHTLELIGRSAPFASGGWWNDAGHYDHYRGKLSKPPPRPTRAP